MKSFLFLLISSFGILSNASSFGCQNENLNQLCLSKVVENCYNCEHLIPEKSLLEPVCVPLFHNNLGVLENYPADKWNCTLYRPQIEESNEFMTEIGEIENESKLIDDVCQVDNFVSTICGHEDKNGFCMIANYIDDICHLDEEKDEEETFDLKQISLQKYESPWGPGSECNQYFYIEICTNKVNKFCFDCRKYLGKELFTQKPRYHYYCSPFYKDMDEKEAVNWLSKEKYECKRWNNPNYKPSSFSIQNYETEGKLYSACTGPICRKEGWFYRGDHFGKEWCGMGKCKEYFGNRVLCDFPTNCGKKMNSIENNFHKQFQTLGCGKEKFKCLLNKDCRQLVKRLDDCNKDLPCLFNLLIEPSVSQNTIFFNLIQCIIPSQ